MRSYPYTPVHYERNRRTIDEVRSREAHSIFYELNIHGFYLFDTHLLDSFSILFSDENPDIFLREHTYVDFYTDKIDLGLLRQYYFEPKKRKILYNRADIYSQSCRINVERFNTVVVHISKSMKMSFEGTLSDGTYAMIFPKYTSRGVHSGSFGKSMVRISSYDYHDSLCLLTLPRHNPAREARIRTEYSS